MASFLSAGQIALTINLIAFVGVIGLMIWSVIWSHMAFNRWEARENAKVKALQRIAAHLTKDDHREHMPSMRAD